MKTLTTLIKELRLFLAIILTVSGTSIFNWELFINYVYMYNIHLGFIGVCGIYINHFLSSKRYKKVELAQDKLELLVTNLLNEQAKTQIRAEVRQAYKDFKNIEVIEFESTIKYLRDLESKRRELEVNSYTDDYMSILLAKIKI